MHRCDNWVFNKKVLIMRSTFLTLFFLLLTLGLTTSEATAGRFGARSFSSHRSSMFSGFNRAKQSNFFSRSRSMQKPSHGFWRGLLMGGLISSLLFGHGFGSALLSWFMLGTLVLLVISFIRRNQPPSRN
ncbi:transmembrane protein (plasmid) [Legionella adelaidensis]|uniref:Transmembrane protein n=1 Tax=Legionella adelaidensis TaxID=45056 RepID=A0A0W0R1L7_9GAMM|nr:transmembrane protein [Legionella adelaidensis]VEH86174.1 transmembrane protein [Legionella adelaidensis]